MKRMIVQSAALAGSLALLINIGALRAREALNQTEEARELLESAAAIHPPREDNAPPVQVPAHTHEKATPKAWYIPESRSALPEPEGVSGTPEPETEARQVPEPFHSPEPQRVYLGKRQVYGYDLCPDCCGGRTDGITASGAAAAVGRTVASNELPLGTVIYIDGIGERIVEDRGGMTGGALDVLCADHAGCYAITGVYDVYIVEARA